MSTIVADVGGTNTRVGLAGSGAVDRAAVGRYRNAEFASLGDILASYLAERALPAPERVCVAVAGPVRHGIGRLTNRDWIVSADELCRVTGAIQGLVINDLSAQGYALDMVGSEPLLERCGDAVPDAEETRLVIGVGTGFNAAPVYRRPGGLMVTPSECGHVTLPVWSEDGARLAAELRRHHGFASVEDLLSGRGMPMSYQLLTGSVPEEPAEILRRAAAEPGGPEGRFLALMVGTLGRVAGDLALTHLPFGGIVFIGGMARALQPFFGQHGFDAALCDKGRFSEFLRQFPVFALTDDFAALDGCALYARQSAA
ncbi:glucokinase [Poseidonocella sp. HB161398]|uniref:glucokinase n=1 Tax=Poseidonocella sp. HB161398 TaxID=2320855 RepID=UPI001107DC46|nr:glucokinase [Poseidonocella sp. HB161398]